MGAVLICLALAVLGWIAKKFGDLAFDNIQARTARRVAKALAIATALVLVFAAWRLPKIPGSLHVIATWAKSELHPLFIHQAKVSDELLSPVRAE